MKAPQPKQYQQGWTEFFKLKFFLTSEVLIPRPETELLVEEVIKKVKSEKCKGQSQMQKDLSLSTHHSALTILDLGTGSGCIAISIAKNLPNVKIFAIDISKNALQVAEKNAKFHKVEKQVLFLESDLLAFQPGVVKSKSPDIIVTNLPYIPTSRLMYIDPMVSEWEPKIALDGGKDGFDLYRKLFTQMNEKKFYPKILIAEIDEVHGETARLEAKNYFPNAKSVEVKKDLTNRDRILKINY